MIDFPETTSVQLGQWLKSADEIVLYAGGGNEGLLSNRQLRIQVQKRAIRAVDLGVDPESPENRRGIRWGNIPFEKRDALLKTLTSSRFAFLPRDPQLPYGAVVLGVEVHQGKSVRRWFWDYDNPSEVAGALRNLLTTELAHMNPDGELRGKAFCGADGKALGVDLEYKGKSQLVLNPPKPDEKPITLEPSSGQATSPQRIAGAKSIWRGLVTGQNGLDASVLISERCPSR